MRGARGWIAGLAGTLALLGHPGGRSAGAEECGAVFSRPTTEVIFHALRAAARGDGCQLEAVRGEGSRIEAHWSRDGTGLAPLVLRPAACAATGSVTAGPVAVLLPAALGAACPATMEMALAELGRLRVPLVADESPEGPQEGAPVGRRLWQLLAGVALALGLGRLWGRRAGPWDPGLGLLAASFGLALAVRCLVEPGPANWYAEVVPARGPPQWFRFGPGSAAFQEILRGLVRWDDRTLFLANAGLGAAAVPVALRLFRACGLSWSATLAGGLLLALSPLHVRLSASTSEHLLASTLALAALDLWIRGAQARDHAALGLAAMLAALSASTRADAWPVLGALPWWGLLVAPGAKSEIASRRWRLGTAALFAGLWLGLGGALYLGVVLPSHHPLPDGAARWATAREVIAQYFVAASRPPGWLPALELGLGLAGAIALGRRRPRLLGAVAVTLLLAFVPLGRSLAHDGLVGARYFLFTLPIFGLLAGSGFAAVTAPLRRGGGRRRALALGGGLALVAAGVALPGGAAYRYRYAFQDEYRFLRGALDRLPAGCVVYSLPLRVRPGAPDLDCCLDLPRSPLTIAFPQLRLRYLPPAPQPIEAGACVAYYEGVACALQPEAVPGPFRAAARELVEACAGAAARGPFSPIAAATIGGHSTKELFAGQSPVVRLLGRRASAPGDAGPGGGAATGRP